MNTFEVKKIWEDVKEVLIKTIPMSSYTPWILPLEAISFEGNQFTLITGESFGQEYIKKHHYKQVLDGFKEVLGEEIIVNIEFDQELSNKMKKLRQAQEKKLQKELIKTKEHEKAIENLSYVQSMNINLRYRFENFVTDENNKIAKVAAETVAKSPAERYNPLYIHGASGLGKTHLMQAIGHYIVFNKPEIKVRCIKTEDFINDYINSTAKNFDKNKTNLMNKFRQKYRNVDVLLIDDIQFLEGKHKCIDEMFNTFDTLYNANKQIVLTSDRLPKEMPELPNRLRTRFEQGLTVEIEPPKFETRVTILENLAKEKGKSVDREVLEYISKYFKNNVRELEGAFNKVDAYSDIEETSLDLNFAKSILKCEELDDKPDIEKVAKEVANYYGTTVEDFKSSTRVKAVSTARAVAAFLCREKLNLGYETIAQYFNKKHQTVLYSYEKIKSAQNSDKKLAKEISKILKNLGL